MNSGVEGGLEKAGVGLGSEDFSAMAGHIVCLSLRSSKAALLLYRCGNQILSALLPWRPCPVLAVYRPWLSVPQVLWPYLLEFLTPVRFTAALTPLCRSLVHLALKRQEAGADAFLVQYNSNGVEAQLPCT